MSENNIVGSEIKGSIGKRLRAWRKSSFLTLVEISKILGVSQGSLSEIENDKSLPSAKTLASLCLNTQINIYWLLTGQGLMIRTVSSLDDKTGFPAEFALVARDSKLKELIIVLIGIYQHGSPEKRARLAGFLHGAA